MEGFIPTKCIFCNAECLPDFEATLSHMRKKHGLFIPTTLDGGSHVLSVDMETLVEYLHMVIFQDHECVSCHTQKTSLEAIQHHMLAKSHCRMDLDTKDSEYRDFYEIDPAVTSPSQNLLVMRMAQNARPLPRPTGLPKPNHKKNPKRKPLPEKPLDRGRASAVEFYSNMVAQANESKTAITIPRDISRMVTGHSSGIRGLLMNLSANDRKALAHLPLPEQLSRVGYYE